MRKIILVSCVKRKVQRPTEAEKLYISDWFKKAATYTKRYGDKWYILSAKYGLLDPKEVIAPYDETLNKMKKEQRLDWAKKVQAQLEKILKVGDVIIILAGKRYREFLVEPIKKMGCHIEIPMKGLKIGDQKKWLNKHLHGI